MYLVVEAVLTLLEILQVVVERDVVVDLELLLAEVEEDVVD